MILSRCATRVEQRCSMRGAAFAIVVLVTMLLIVLNDDPRSLIHLRRGPFHDARHDPQMELVYAIVPRDNADTDARWLQDLQRGRATWLAKQRALFLVPRGNHSADSLSMLCGSPVGSSGSGSSEGHQAAEPPLHWCVPSRRGGVNGLPRYLAAAAHFSARLPAAASDSTSGAPGTQSSSQRFLVLVPSSALVIPWNVNILLATRVGQAADIDDGQRRGGVAVVGTAPRQRQWRGNGSATADSEGAAACTGQGPLGGPLLGSLSVLVLDERAAAATAAKQMECLDSCGAFSSSISAMLCCVRLAEVHVMYDRALCIAPAPASFSRDGTARMPALRSLTHFPVAIEPSPASVAGADAARSFVNDLTLGCFVAVPCRRLTWLRRTSCCAQFRKRGDAAPAPNSRPIQWDVVAAWLLQQGYSPPVMDG